MTSLRRLTSMFGVLLVLTLAPAGVLAQGTFAPPSPRRNITTEPVCDAVTDPAYVQCFAIIRTDSPSAGPTSDTPFGLFPADLQDAYNLNDNGAPGTGPLVAIVDAYDDPHAEDDLNVYRQQFGLGACTSQNGCFKKVNQSGVEGSYPLASPSWSQEISLDLDMVSAICPSCKILLVEANSNSTLSLGQAVNTAVNLGAVAVSNSYGGPESFFENWIDSQYFHHPGVAITASAGDNGYGVSFPAASQYVTAVGGTSLTPAANARGWDETTWSGTGSGCSRFVPKPVWQLDTAGCGKRTVADVSAVADPATGVAVYDSYAYKGRSGWLRFGGTSVSAPIIAAIYALAGNAGSMNDGSYSYSHTGSLNDVTSGSNSRFCGWLGPDRLYLCSAGTGYDGPTGNGTPNGTGGF